MSKREKTSVEFTTRPMDMDIAFITGKINDESRAFGPAHPFAFFQKNESGQIIAGCNGSVIFGSIYTDQLWVDPGYRQQGIGKALMEKVHDYGQSLHCSIATVTTMDFQKACPFYEKLGYVVVFEQSGYTNNGKCLFLKKAF